MYYINKGKQKNKLGVGRIFGHQFQAHCTSFMPAFARANSFPASSDLVLAGVDRTELSPDEINLVVKDTILYEEVKSTQEMNQKCI